MREVNAYVPGQGRELLGVNGGGCDINTKRIACILCMHLGACRFFMHPTALMHLKSILCKCIQLHFIFVAHTRMGSD